MRRRGISYGKWPLEGDLVALNGLNGGRWNDGLSLWGELWGDINWLPLDWGLLCIVSVYVRRDMWLVVRTPDAAKMSLTDWEISGPIPSPSIKETA